LLSGVLRSLSRVLWFGDSLNSEPDVALISLLSEQFYALLALNTMALTFTIMPYVDMNNVLLALVFDSDQ
jgi:hypothetical protein